MKSAIELELLWSERDQRYAMRRFNGMFRPVDEQERQSVIAFRRAEAEMLPSKEKTIALIQLAQWQPPTRAMKA